MSVWNRIKLAMNSFVLRQLNRYVYDVSREFAEEIVRLQTAQNADTRRIFHWVQSGDLTALKEVIASDPHINLYDIDAAGANIVHLAYLYEFYDMGHWLVESYPNLALKPYSDEVPSEFAGKGYTSEMMPYTGENILHIVIVRRDYAEVRWLLDFFKDHKDSVPNGLAKLLMMSNATGKFFDPSGDFYFGGYPLQFAVCANCVEIFDLVLAFASSLDSTAAALKIDQNNHSSEGAGAMAVGPNVIFMRDTFGNTMLHLCVIHGLTEMFHHILSIAATVINRELQLYYSIQKTEESGNTGVFCLPELPSDSGYGLPEKSLRIPEPDKYNAWLVQETKTKLDERLLLVLNNSLQSPLTLAASLSQKETATVGKERRIEMLQTVMSSTSNKVRLWNYGPLVCFDLNLKGLEVEYDLRQYGIEEVADNDFPKNFDAIKWLCINQDTQSIQISEVREIIQRKWERCGLPLFILDCLMDMFITLIVTLISIFVNARPTLYPHFGFELFVNILYAIALVLFLLLSANEISAFSRHGWYVSNLRGVAKFNASIRLAKIVAFFVFFVFTIYEAGTRGWRNEFFLNQSRRSLTSTNSSSSFPSSFPSSTPTSISVIYNPQDYPGSKISLSLCVVLCWFNLYYYMMGFKRTGPFMLAFKKVIEHDLPYFLQFFFIPVVGIACCLSVLENSGMDSIYYAYWNVLLMIWNLIQKSVSMNVFNNITISELVPSNMRWLSTLLLTSFYAFVVIIMLNLLIAIINDTYSSSAAFDESVFLIEKCNIIDFLEKHMTVEAVRLSRGKYCSVKEVVIKDKDEDELHLGSIMDIPPSGPAHHHQYHPNPSKTSNIEELTFELVEVDSGWFTESSSTTSSRREAPKTSLFIIDAQVDFHPGGSLAVPGADEDSHRIAEMIKANKRHIHEIFVSMDSHHPNHIAHAMFWTDGAGQQPAPFTEIRYADVKSGRWMPRERTPEVMDWCLSYTKALERKGHVKLCIWPPHCLIGYRGHCIVPSINEALQEWAAYSKRPVNYIMKGQNCRTEMYSALEAEVVDPLDHSTALNNELLSMLRVAERVCV